MVFQNSETAATLVFKTASREFGNDDNNGIENAANKSNLRPFKLYRVYLDPFNLSNAGNSPGVEFLRTFSRYKRERKIRRRMFTSSIKRRIRWFYVVVVHWTPKKCTKKRDALLLKVLLQETIRNDDF